MSQIVVLLVLALVIVAFTYGVARTLLHVWIDHRVRLALLNRYQDDPDGFPESAEVADLVAEQQFASTRTNRQDYRLTGAILCALGVASVIAASQIGLGTLAVGLYTGGIMCIVLGVLIALLGILINALAKPPLANPAPRKPA